MLSHFPAPVSWGICEICALYLWPELLVVVSNWDDWGSEKGWLVKFLKSQCDGKEVRSWTFSLCGHFLLLPFLCAERMGKATISCLDFFILYVWGYF